MSQKEKKVEEPSDYEKAEIDQLREALKRSHEEKFLIDTRLYKIQKMMQKAVIPHKPNITK